MCGITGGVWTAEGKPLSDAELRRMVAAITHRGPDEAGCHTGAHGTDGITASRSPWLSFGFRRLSIIDLSTGHQPMTDGSGRFWVVFNGEIYNYRELREQLVSRGHVFRTTSDTEVLLESYKAYGTECVRHFRGMFAFAI